MIASRIGSAAVLGLLVAASASAVNTNSQCVGNLQSPLSPGNSCTANDVTFVFVGLGDQTDGCLTTSDNVSLYMGVRLENTSGQTRYDIGLFVYNYLGTGDPTPNAFGGQQCAVENLEPAYGTTGTNTCGPLNLSGGSGPFYNADGNSCADLVKGQCNNSPVFMQFTSPVTVKCTDTTGPNGSASPDGFVDIPACTTWGNNAGQVGPGGSCNTEADIMPGTGSKCRCETINSSVPVARLAASCSCSPAPVRPGQSTACTVGFTNTVPNCTATAASPSNPERFQCGTASYLRYKVAYNAAQGQVLNSSPATPSETTGGSVTVDTSNSRVVWEPRNTTASGTSLGVIGPNESGSMTYQFYVDPSVASGTTITQTVTPFWSNVGPAAWTNEVAQSTVNCSFTVSNAATFSRVSSFAARSEGGQVVVAWETAAEVGTVAFEVERQDPESGAFVRLTERPVPAVAQLPGGRYRLVDPSAPQGQALTYRLIEVDQRGGREILGPFRVEVAEASADHPGGGDFQVRAKDVSDRLTRAALTRKVAPASAAPGATPRRVRIEVAQGGLQQVRAADLAAALGLPPAEVLAQLRAGRIRLSRTGQDVAWHSSADGNGLLFHGEELHTAYTDVNVYWLEIGRGQQMATLPAGAAGGTAAPSFLDTLHLETDAIPAVASPKPVDDFWIWKSLFPGFPGFDRATLNAAVPTPAPGAASLTVHLVGFAAAQRAEVWLNGARVGDLAWEGDGPVSLPVALPSGSLLDGANQIEVVAIEASRGLWLDAFDLTYPRQYRAQSGRLTFRAPVDGAVAVTGFATPDIAVYDVAQPRAPRRLAGLSSMPQADGSWGISFKAPGAGPFVAVTAGSLAGPRLRASTPVVDLESPGRAAAYLVITAPELHAEAQRLADLRSAQGLSSLVVDVGDVMDVFGHGLYDPQAIQRFLAHALRSWSTPPRYVVLAGKGSYDYRNLLGLSSSLVPPLLVATEAGLAPADAAYADLGSGVPAVAIGRIPALTAAEMRAFVDKVAAYENDPGGAWTNQVLLAADAADFGGDFPVSSEAVAGTLAPGFNLSRVYSPADGAQMPAARSQLQDALRQGQVVMNYVGHGGLDRLDSEGLLLTSDVAQLGNAPRLPVLTALTCLISQFAYPTVTSLGEELVLQPDGGAIAVYGPTWLSHNTPATALGGHLMPQLTTPGAGRLGDRLQEGLEAYAAAGGDRRMVRLYTLLGDPGLVMKSPLP